jgi:hypothetical protein
MAKQFDGYELRNEEYYKHKLNISKITGTKIICSEDAYIEYSGNDIIDYAFKNMPAFFKLGGNIKKEMKVLMPTSLTSMSKIVEIAQKQLFCQTLIEGVTEELNDYKLFFNEYV